MSMVRWSVLLACWGLGSGVLYSEENWEDWYFRIHMDWISDSQDISDAHRKWVFSTPLFQTLDRLGIVGARDVRSIQGMGSADRAHVLIRVLGDYDAETVRSRLREGYQECTDASEDGLQEVASDKDDAGEEPDDGSSEDYDGNLSEAHAEAVHDVIWCRAPKDPDTSSPIVVFQASAITLLSESLHAVGEEAYTAAADRGNSHPSHVARWSRFASHIAAHATIAHTWAIRTEAWGDHELLRTLEDAGVATVRAELNFSRKHRTGDGFQTMFQIATRSDGKDDMTRFGRMWMDGTFHHAAAQWRDGHFRTDLRMDDAAQDSDEDPPMLQLMTHMPSLKKWERLGWSANTQKITVVPLGSPLYAARSQTYIPVRDYTKMMSIVLPYTYYMDRLVAVSEEDTRPSTRLVDWLSSASESSRMHYVLHTQNFRTRTDITLAPLGALMSQRRKNHSVWPRYLDEHPQTGQSHHFYRDLQSVSGVLEDIGVSWESVDLLDGAMDLEVPYTTEGVTWLRGRFDLDALQLRAQRGGFDCTGQKLWSCTISKEVGAPIVRFYATPSTILITRLDRRDIVVDDAASVLEETYETMTAMEPFGAAYADTTAWWCLSLTNALSPTLPDFEKTPGSYKRVTFRIDIPSSGYVRYSVDAIVAPENSIGTDSGVEQHFQKNMLYTAAATIRHPWFLNPSTRILHAIPKLKASSGGRIRGERTVSVSALPVALAFLGIPELVIPQSEKSSGEHTWMKKSDRADAGSPAMSLLYPKDVFRRRAIEKAIHHEDPMILEEQYSMLPRLSDE